MLKISNQEILQQENEITAIVKANSGLPLYHEDLLKQVFPRLHEEWEITYPRVIKIAPSMNELRKGSTEPGRIITINEPIMSKRYGIPMWFGNAEKGMFLVGMGYRNGDKRFPCLVPIDDNNIHFFLGGATGHGKSVALNSLILTACYLYPPWEVNFIMSDAKVVEFKKYMRGFLPPHIRSISASSDPDYIISMLEHYHTEMKTYNGLYSNYGGAGNYTEFRKNSGGLTLARNLIIMDEFTVTLNAGQRKAARIEYFVEDYARLGRNTAYHIGLSSQDASAVSPGVFTNVPVRAALGCHPPVSEKIIGNDEASIYYKEKGRMILNLNPVNGAKKENIHLRVPFQSTPEFQAQLEELYHVGKEIGWETSPTMYDEVTYLREENYLKLIDKAPLKPHTVYLGEPSFIYTKADETGFLRIEFDGEDQDNLVIIGGRSADTTRFVKTVLYNLKRVSSVSNSVLYILNGDQVLGKELDLTQYTDNCYSLRSIDADPYHEIKGVFLDRHLVIQADSRIFDGTGVSIHPMVKGIMEEEPNIPNEWITDINLKRISAMMGLLTKPPFRGYLVEDSSSPEELIKAALPTLYTYNDVGCVGGERATKERFKRLHVFVFGFNRIQGLGLNAIRSEQSYFKQFLQECSTTNIHVTVSTFNTEEMGEFKNEFRYGLYDQTTPAAFVRTLLKSEVLPVAKVLAFMVDRAENLEDPLRFKKFAMNEESFA